MGLPVHFLFKCFYPKCPVISADLLAYFSSLTECRVFLQLVTKLSQMHFEGVVILLLVFPTFSLAGFSFSCSYAIFLELVHE